MMDDGWLVLWVVAYVVNGGMNDECMM